MSVSAPFIDDISFWGLIPLTKMQGPLKLMNERMSLTTNYFTPFDCLHKLDAIDIHSPEFQWPIQWYLNILPHNQSG